MNSVTPSVDGEQRCACGALMARLVDGGIELRCRRCRRVVVIRLADLDRGRTARVEPHRRPSG